MWGQTSRGGSSGTGWPGAQVRDGALPRGRPAPARPCHVDGVWVWQLRAGPTLPTAAPSWGDANETQVRAALPAWPFLAALRTSRTAAVPGDATGCVGALRGLLGLWEQRADT